MHKTYVDPGQHPDVSSGDRAPPSVHLAGHWCTLIENRGRIFIWIWIGDELPLSWRVPLYYEMMPMKITTVSEVSAQQNPHHVDVRPVFSSPHAMAVVITLQPGEALKKHITPVDVFFYVLEGTGIVEIGEERAVVSKDSLVESPARIPHRWSNESDEVFRVLVVKVPKPTEETKLL